MKYLTTNQTFIQNKYLVWYCSIIHKALARSKTREEAKQICGYVEGHHILPKCLNGGNQSQNIVYLTAKEHFICHHLLTKFVIGTEAKRKIERAFWAMSMAPVKITPFLYKRMKSIGSLSEETKQKISNSLKGHVVSEQTKRKLSEANLGRVISEETKKKIQYTHKNKKYSYEERKRMGDPLRGKRRPDISKRMKGDNHPFFGKFHSEEAKRNISKTMTGVKRGKYKTKKIFVSTHHLSI